MNQRARRFIHHESQLHRLFIWPGRPTSEARPIRFSRSCPNACHLAHISQNTLHVSRYSSGPIYLDFSVFAPSLFSLLMRSELVLNIMTWSQGQVCKWNAHFGSESIRDKRRMCRASRTKLCIRSTWHHINRTHTNTSLNAIRFLLLPYFPSESMACTGCHSGIPDHMLTMLTVRF